MRNWRFSFANNKQFAIVIFESFKYIAPPESEQPPVIVNPSILVPELFDKLLAPNILELLFPSILGKMLDVSRDIFSPSFRVNGKISPEVKV